MKGAAMNGHTDADDAGNLEMGAMTPALRREVKALAQREFSRKMQEALGSVPRPIDWDRLTPEDLEHELLALNAFVDWLRHRYGLPAQIIPPMWHRHPEMVEELSALRQDRLFCYDRQAKGNMALVWHQGFAAARERLRDWVMIAGSRLDRDRPTRITEWPGGESEDWAPPSTEETPVTERTKDFLAFVEEQVAARQAGQDMLIEKLVQQEDLQGRGET